MGFQLLEVHTDADFIPLWLAFREAFNNPINPLWPLLFGDWRPHDAVYREAALDESRARWISWHRADPTSTWLKVVDEETGEIAAGGRWSIHTSGKPYDGHQPMEATWFPEGEPRKVATQYTNDLLDAAVRNVNRPHAFLNVLFTVPKYRRQGAASMIMDWGFDKAKKAGGLDVYIEATKEGKPLYEKYGLRTVQESFFDPELPGLPKADDPAYRKEAVDSMTPFTWWSMLGKSA